MPYKNKDKRNELWRLKTLKYKQTWHKILQEIADVKCQACGYDRCFAALDFHHDGKKDFLISKWMRRKAPTEKNIEIFKDEVAKGYFLCATCHRELHKLA